MSHLCSDKSTILSKNLDAENADHNIQKIDKTNPIEPFKSKTILTRLNNTIGAKP